MFLIFTYCRSKVFHHVQWFLCTTYDLLCTQHSIKKTISVFNFFIVYYHYRSLSRDAITEEKCSKSLPESERMGVRRLPLGQQSLPREPFFRQLTMASNLTTSSSSEDSSDENTWVPRRGDHDRLPLLKYRTLE